MSKGDKILRKHLPKLESSVKELGKKEMTESVAAGVMEKADKILSKNFKGKKLDEMRLQLSKTILDLRKNTRKEK